MPDDQPTADTRPSRWTLPLLALIVLLGAGLRLYDVTHSLWLDELHTAWCVSGDFSDIAPRARIGNYSPLYFWVVWASTQVFGLTEWGVRFPSLLAGIALIPLGYLFAVRLTDVRSAGLLAALLIALDGMTLGWYSQEARPYALVMLVGLLQFWLFYELFEQPTWLRRLLFVTATVALFYLHYTAILLLTGEMAWYLCRRVCTAMTRNGATPYRWYMLALDLAVVVTCYLPVAAHVSEIYQRRSLWSQFVPDMSLPGWLNDYSVPLGVWIIVAGCYFTHRRALGIYDRNSLSELGRSLNPSPGIGFFLCWYCVPVGIAALMTHLGIARVLYPRYLLVCIPALPLAAAWGVRIIPPVVRWQFAVMFLVVYQFGALRTAGLDIHLAVGRYLANGLIMHHAEDWRGGVAHIRAADPDGRYPVFLRAGLIEDQLLPQRAGDEEFRRYLLFPISGIYSLDDDRVLEPLGKEWNRFLTKSDIDRLATAGGGWMLLRWSGQVDRFVKMVGKELADQQISCPLAEKRQFRGVVVLRFATDR